MIIYIQILLVLFAIGFAITYNFCRAQVVFSIGLAFMIGLEWRITEVIIAKKHFDMNELVFSFGPINATCTWYNQLRDEA